MARTVAIGSQRFADIRQRGCFLVDKTDFIRQWWGSYKDVTVLCRPRRFGKTLALSMVECFFSTKYAHRGDLFEGLAVWDDLGLRADQGSWPVIFLSFADIKAANFTDARAGICREIARLYARNRDLLDDGLLGEGERMFFESVRDDMPDAVATVALNRLCEFMGRASGKRVIVLLDEYDTPMQEAWLCGYWDQMTGFIRQLYNSTFKTNPFIERGLVTGITCVAEESIFSDMNNPDVVTTTSCKYETCFGFTADEVFAAMDEFGLTDRDEVRYWYDGFTFGDVQGIYNPWSITKFLDCGGRFDPYWTNTSGNGLVSRLVREGDTSLKLEFENLLRGGTVTKALDERVPFKLLGKTDGAAWPLLVASGYLKVVSSSWDADARIWLRELAITNFETMRMFDGLILDWFGVEHTGGSPFARALLGGDVQAMNAYMADLVEETVSSFDSGVNASRRQPERFWHGLVLGLLVELRRRYYVRSNPQSGFGRVDVLLEPADPAHDDGIIIEFKICDSPAAGAMEKTVDAAKAQIAEKRYAAELVSRGVPADRIRAYGFAFRGKEVLVG